MDELLHTFWIDAAEVDGPGNGIAYQAVCETCLWCGHWQRPSDFKGSDKCDPEGVALDVAYDEGESHRMDEEG